MSRNLVKWLALLILLMLAFSIIGLIAYARGEKHHHGDDVGTHGTKIIVVQPAG